VKEQLHEALGHAGLDHSLDLVVVTIGEIRDGPAGMGQDLVVSRVEEHSEGGEHLAGQGPVGGRVFATAEVGQSPGGSRHHRGLVLRFLEELEEGEGGPLSSKQYHGTLDRHQQCCQGPRQPARGHRARGFEGG